ncbi:hypothetical protein [Sphingomonas daechungensis]|uniref:bestrophin-like domain n=1 Tax=Sphingomonas daechungensis TaxID=1176646 RepID=UPI003784D118
MSQLISLDPLMHALPLWAVGLVLIGAALLAVEVGAWWGKFLLDKTLAEKRLIGSDTQGFIIGSVFGLLALLIGLTFSLALDRYDERRNWVAEEANAISTAYLRASLFDEPYKTELKSTLREYAHSRIVPENITPETRERLGAKSEALRDRLWGATEKAVFPVRATELGSYFVEAVNQMLDVGTSRALASRAHIPGAILGALYLFLVVSSALLGSMLAKDGTRQRYASTILVILFVLGIVMIIDLDRPRAGSILVSQRGLEELAAAMDRDAKAPRQSTAVTRVQRQRVQ